jgi:NAD(P)-dependent dehydrogenase (short-subunit alcohol dehydrogenase family)
VSDTANLTFSSAIPALCQLSPLDDLRVEDWEEMIDINIKGVLYGIAAALPVLHKQGFGHFVNPASTAALITKPNQSVYSGTKFAVRAISEGLRQEAGDKLRVTIISGVTRRFSRQLPACYDDFQRLNHFGCLQFSPSAAVAAHSGPELSAFVILCALPC